MINVMRFAASMRSSQRSSLRFFSSYMAILVLAGLIILFMLVFLTGYQDRSMTMLGQGINQTQLINAIVQQTRMARAQADRFLISGREDDFTTANAALNSLTQTIDQTDISDLDTRKKLETLSTLGLNYGNTFRSLATLILFATPNNSETAIRQIVEQNGIELENYGEGLIDQRLTALDTSVQNVHSDNNLWRVIMFLVFAATFAGSLALVVHLTHNTTFALNSIGAAAQAISQGDFSAHVSLKRNDEIGHLATAFNQMAENLKLALYTEATASEQNRQQIMKLARQERATAILEERQRIARELHDSVKQQLFSITLATGAALNLLEHDLGLVRTYLEHIQDTGRFAQAEMTTLLQEMIPLPLMDQRLEDALIQYLTPLCDVHNLKLRWRVEGTNTLTIAQEHALFRVAQEAVSNVIRHSTATVLHLSLSFGLQTFFVVEDNGQGFDPEKIPTSSTGLATMRIRLKQIGGVLRLNSAPGRGTRIEVVVDLRRKTLT